MATTAKSVRDATKSPFGTISIADQSVLVAISLQADGQPVIDVVNGEDSNETAVADGQDLTRTVVVNGQDVPVATQSLLFSVVAHPNGEPILVSVPASDSAVAGQTMLVPIAAEADGKPVIVRTQPVLVRRINKGPTLGLVALRPMLSSSGSIALEQLIVSSLDPIS